RPGCAVAERATHRTTPGRDHLGTTERDPSAVRTPPDRRGRVPGEQPRPAGGEVHDPEPAPPEEGDRSEVPVRRARAGAHPPASVDAREGPGRYAEPGDGQDPSDDSSKSSSRL